MSTKNIEVQDPWSLTKQDLFARLRSYREKDKTGVVATVIDVEGSAYRRPGAKMLIDPDQESYGAITAGCLEEPVVELAETVLQTGEPSVHTFDLIESEEEWGLGLGCNGIIDILLEPLDESWDPIIDALTARQSVASVTQVDGRETGNRVLYDSGTFSSVPDREQINEDILEGIREPVEAFVENEGSGVVSRSQTDDAGKCFIDWLSPAPVLLLFGNQNDVHPVSKIGRQTGFKVIVASNRAVSGEDPFPYATEIRTIHPMEIADVVEDPERTYAVLMSHNLLDDRLALESLLETAVPYIGLMGPRERFEELREALREDEGQELSRDELQRIATPVGLDLGGGEPIEIALSIVGEVLAVSQNRGGGRLKEQEGPIHDRHEAHLER